MKLSELNKKRMPTHGLLEAWDIRHFYRKASLPFTYVLYHLGFTANMVSVLMIFVSFFTAYLIMQGNVVLGIFLWQLWLILDSVDGEIARLRNECSSKGWFLELVFENVCFPINFIALGFSAGFIGSALVGFIIALLWIYCICTRYNYLECIWAKGLNDEDIRKRDNWLLSKLRYLTYGEFKTVIAFWALVFAIFGYIDIFLVLAFIGMIGRALIQFRVLYVSLRKI